MVDSVAGDRMILKIRHRALRLELALLEAAIRQLEAREQDSDVIDQEPDPDAKTLKPR